MTPHPRHPLRRYGPSVAVVALFTGPWLNDLGNWRNEAVALFSVLVVAVLIAHRRIQQRRSHRRDLQNRLARMEELLDSVHFRLFEEQGQRSNVERYFDERRRDLDYDHAYRQSWRALQEAAALDDEVPVA